MLNEEEDTKYLEFDPGIRNRSARLPFYLGIAAAVVGLLMSLTLVGDTTGHASEEARVYHNGETQPKSFKDVFAETSYRHPTLFSVSQAGLVNNLNDGVAWGLFPLFFASHGLGIKSIGILVATYPAVWSVLQVATGALSDRLGRKWLIVIGMWVQALGILLVITAPSLTHDQSETFLFWIIGSMLLGLGTALVYPTLLAAMMTLWIRRGGLQPSAFIDCGAILGLRSVHYWPVSLPISSAWPGPLWLSQFLLLSQE